IAGRWCQKAGACGYLSVIDAVVFERVPELHAALCGDGVMSIAIEVPALELVDTMEINRRRSWYTIRIVGNTIDRECHARFVGIGRPQVASSRDNGDGALRVA